MKVRMEICLVGAGFVHNPGDVLDMPDGQAKRMIDAGYASPAKGKGRGKKQPIETATSPDAVNLQTPEG